MKSEAIYFITLVLFAFSLAGCAKKSDVIELKIGHSLDVEHPVHKAMLFMAEKLKEKSGGKVILQVYPGEQLGSEREMI
jgi:TRAP-type C4-dicarboxylate transport system substrate-binding protein